MKVNENGQNVGSVTFETGKGKPGVLNFATDDFTEKDNDLKPNAALPFSSMLVLNKNDPTKIAFGTNYAYTTTDEKLLADPAPLLQRAPDKNTLGGVVSAMSYGTKDNVDALLVGAPNGLFPPTTATGNLTKITPYAPKEPFFHPTPFPSPSTPPKRFFPA